nr:MAG TPA: hypothetical protein [Bacteriophage sp.]
MAIFHSFEFFGELFALVFVLFFHSTKFKIKLI